MPRPCYCRCSHFTFLIMQTVEQKKIRTTVKWLKFFSFPNKWISSSSRVASKFAQCVNAFFTLKKILFLITYLIFVSFRTFFFPYLPSSPSCSNDFYCILFCVNFFPCLWHIAMFFVSQSFISLPPNPPHAFLFLEKHGLYLIRSFWPLSISCWKFTYLKFVK